MEEGEKEERKKGIIERWLRDKENRGIIAIMLLTIIVRVYFFIQSSGQALWWDEAEYMASAKHWAFGVPYDLNPQRPPLFQLLGAILLKIGLSEAVIQFLIVVIPSIVTVYVIYLFGKELFSKRIGLFASFATAVFWSYIFWTERFQPDSFSILFQMLSLLFFWKMFKEDKRKDAILAGVFAALGFYFKISALLVPLSAAIFALWVNGWKILTKKNYWISLGAFIITMIPLLIWMQLTFGSAFAFAPSYIEGTDKANRDLGWQVFTYFYLFPQKILFILFIIGLLMLIFRTIIAYDVIIKSPKIRLSPEIFVFFVVITISLFYLYYIQGIIEDRWVFLLAPMIFYFSASGVFFITDMIKGYKKEIGAILVLIILVIFAYQQLTFTSQIISVKKDSYAPVRDSGIWLKENTPKDSKIMSISYTQTTAYSERNTSSYSWIENTTTFERYLDEAKPDYIIVSMFEPHPAWVFQRGQYPDGSTAFILPYMNSTIIISPQGQALQVDIKSEVIVKGNTFRLVYPKNEFNGLFVYEIKYE